MTKQDDHDAPGESHSSLLALPLECISNIVSFVSAPIDLLALDATSHSFGALTDPYWAGRAKDAFGIGTRDGISGKSAWQKGKALTSPDRGCHYVFQIEPEEVSFCESIAASCNSHTIVSCSARWEHMGDSEVENPLILRDAKTLKQRAVLDVRNGHHNWWEPALGGLPGSEAIGLTGKYSDIFAVAQKGGHYNLFDLSRIFPEDEHQLVDCLKILACENHFILCGSSKLYLFNFNGSLPLSESNQVAPVLSVKLPSYRRNEQFEETGDEYGHCMKWGSEDLPTGTFVVGGTGVISVWHLNDATSELKRTQKIVTGTREEFDDCSVGERYIVGCVATRPIVHVFDRSSGKKVTELSLTNGNADAERYFSPNLHFVGDILVCTFYYAFGSSGLSIWNLRNGSHETFWEDKVLRRDSSANDFDDDITNLVQLNGDGYTCYLQHSFDGGATAVFGLPESARGLLNLQDLVLRHTYVSGPPFKQKNRKRSRLDRLREDHKQTLALLIDEMKEDWHQKFGEQPTTAQLLDHCTDLLGEALEAP